MSGPLVSVVMITYNQSKYIAAAIEGVLNQEVPFQYELVIGEDCSTDGTREIVSTYQKNHPEIIRVITSDIHVGMVRNFFRTSRACTGAFLAFCEGDECQFSGGSKAQRRARDLVNCMRSLQEMTGPAPELPSALAPGPLSRSIPCGSR
jgi:glycosyltransferase involved in cell wall biosynthesis